MCTEIDAKRLIEEAKKEEKNNPAKARKNYLEAAEIMLLLSEQKKEIEGQCVELAQVLFDRAQRLPKEAPVEFSPAQSISSEISFTSIGGLQKLKEEIRFKIIEPFSDPEVFEYFGKKVGGGILMYGPPGCGKSLIAEATANEAKASFFNVKASDLKGKYVGETEKNIAELFAAARKRQPSIIFFDEFEALGMERTNSQPHDKSAVAQLLSEMDGVGVKNQQILLLAATNEPWSIDSALLREGRFGRTLFIPPPDVEARKDILKMQLAKRPLSPDVSITALAEKTVGFSGADLAALCEIASDIPLREYFKTRHLRKMTMSDFETALKEIKSVIPQWMKKAKGVVERLKLQEVFPELIH